MERVRVGANGRALCRWCGVEVAGRRRTFCSDSCVHEWRLRSSTSYLRECVLERDRGICAECGIDTLKLRRSVMRLPFAARMLRIRELIGSGAAARRRKSWWEADHILAVAEGGDSSLDNIPHALYPLPPLRDGHAAKAARRCTSDPNFHELSPRR